MKAIFGAVVVVLSGFGSVAQADMTEQFVHYSLCDQAATKYPRIFRDAADCVARTEASYVGTSIQISFPSCATGEWIQAGYNLNDGQYRFATSALLAGNCAKN